MSTAAPGWYDDGSGRQRFWDGSQWGPLPDPTPPTTQSHAAPGVFHPAQSYPPAVHGVGSPGAAPVPYQASSPGAVPVAYPQGSYGAAVPGTRTNGVGVAGFVVGLVSVFLPLFLGVIGGLAGLVLSIIGLASHNPTVHSGRGLSIAGLVLSIVALILIL